jgi:hypothetical protein
MNSKNINEDDWSEDDITTAPKSDGFVIHNSILLAVFFGVFILWNCGGTGIFSFIDGSFPPVWKFKDAWGIFIFEIIGLVSSGFQTFIFIAVCGAVNAIGVFINKNQLK